MPDVGIGSIISAGASLLGGAMQSDSASSAAQTQSDAATQAAQIAAQAQEKAIAEQRRQFDLTRSDLAPYRTVGTGAVNTLANYLGLAPSSASSDTVSMPLADWQNDPRAENFATPELYNAYQAERQRQASADANTGALTRKFTVGDFWADPVTQLSLQYGLDEGTKALNRQAASRGMLNSGAQLKGITRFANDYVGQQAAGSRERFVGDQTNLYNRLAGLAGTGQQATNAGAAAGANAANTIGNIYTGTANTLGNLYTGAGNARGAAAIAGGNAWGGALGNIGNYFGQQQTLDKLLNSRNGMNSNYSSVGSFTPYYSGYGMQGDYQYG